MLKKAIFLSLFAFAFVTSASAAITPTAAQDLRQDGDGCYAIGSKEELYGFARLLNEAYEANYSDPILASCVKLTQNITVNSKVLNADGELANDPASYEMWTPISQFNGIFDGQGHAISGLFIIADGDAGLFRSVDGATIKNIGIIDAFVEGSGSGNGAFAGHSNFNGSMSTTTTFENAYVKNSLIVSDCYAGGLVGWSYFNLVIKNSFNDNTAVFSYKNDYNYAAGGLIGIANQNVAVTNSFVTGKVTAPNAGGVVGTFQGNLFSFVNSFVSGKISGTHMAGSVVGYRANDYEPISTEHSYQLNDIVSMDEACWMPSRVVNMNLVAAYDIKWGALAAKLRDYNENGVDGSVWGQNFSKNEDHPTLSGSITSAPASSKLTLVTYTGDVTAYPTIYVHGQSNNALPIAARDGYKFMGWYTNISFAGEPVEFVPTTAIGDKIYYAKLVDMKDENGCYAIETVDELYYFASVVNNGEVSACGKLMNNIVINENVIKDGVLNGDGSNFRQWNPIGNIGKNPPFMGIFDGQGYTISGLYVNMNRGNLGLFGFVSGTSVQIKNLKVVDSYVSSTVGGNNIGGIVGNVGGALSLDDVSFSGIVSSPNSYDVGGLVGYASGVMGTVSMNRVSFAGTVMGSSEIGGILGKNYGVDLLINEASFEGLARAPSGYVGGIVGNSSTYDGISLKIENSVSAGTIESISSSYAGGFVGISYGNTKISKGKNYASVNGPGYVGGFVGYVSNLELVNSYNSGNVTTSGSYAGGLVGLFNGSYIANCYNVGDVTGSDYVGGLAGNAYDMAILNSFHYGNVQGFGYDVGAVVGYANDNALFENVFYVGASGNQYGSSVLKSLFDNGVLASVMKAYNSEYADGSVWGQNVVNGDAYPTLSGAIYGGATASKGSLTLRLSDGTEVTDEYIEGISKNLPKFIGDTQVLFWSSKEDLNDEIAAVPASSKGSFVAYGRALAIKIVDDCYQISNADELYEFAEIVNRGEKNVCGNLVKDIVINEGVLNENLGLNDKEYRLWTPIGNTSHNYFGSFDGQGHVISGLVTKNDDYAGLFGIAATATIKNVGIEDSYIQGTKYAGGIVAYADVYTFELTNSYSVAVVRVAEDGKAAGGLVGGLGDYSPYLVANCFHIGEVSGGKISGGIAGNSSLYSVYNSYHDESSGFDQYLALLDDGFKKGTVAKYLHNYNENSVDGSIWGQDPSKGEWHPNFSGKIAVPYSRLVYHLSDGTDIESTYEEGVETKLPRVIEGKSIAAWVKETDYGFDYYYDILSSQSGDLEVYGLVESIQKVDGCYEITNASELYEFASKALSEMNACGKLTKDIVVNENVLNADGSLNSENTKLRQWTPIGSWGNPFKGTFDGQGHSISGLYFKKNVIESNYSRDVGLFGYVESYGTDPVVIKNVIVKDSYLMGYENVAGIVGRSVDANLRLEACGFEGTAYSTRNYVAGLIANIDERTAGVYNVSVVNCYNAGHVVGNSSSLVAGLIAHNAVSLGVYNSYTIAEKTDLDGNLITYSNNVAYSTKTFSYNNVYCPSNNNGAYCTGSAYENYLAEGYLAKLLHDWSLSINGVDYTGDVWGQNIAGGETHPTIKVKSLVVYHLPDGTTVEDSYTEGLEKELPAVLQELKVLAWYTTSEMNEEPVSSITADMTGELNFYAMVASIKLVDGCYEMGTADELYEFALLVNGGEYDACGKLTADIVVNENVLDAEGNLKKDISEYRKWTPIGLIDMNNGDGSPFAGTFDGQGHTISGLVTDENAMFGGLFGLLSSMDENPVTIKNVGLVDSYIQGVFAGGISGAEEGVALIENVYVAASVVGIPFAEMDGFNRAGGFIAGASSVFIKNSFFVGKTFSPNALTGNFVAWSMENPSDIICQNNFFIGTEDDSFGNKAVSAEAFTDGTVAMALRGDDENSIWGQNVAKGDKYPNFSGKVVKTEIALDWDNASETVTIDASKVDEFTEVIVEPGKEFYYNGAIYKDTLNLAQIEEIAGKELKPISGVSLEKDEDNNLVASLSTGAVTDKVIIPEDIEVSNVDIGITFVPGKTMTLMLPFDYTVPEGLGTISKFTKVEQIDGVWTATGTRVENGQLEAHTPYLITVAEETDGKLTSGEVTIKANVNIDTDDGEGNWTFKGTYEGKTWVKGDPELGHVYGFAANKQDGVASPGDFVKVGAGASIPPMRAYLYYTANPVTPKPSVDGVAVASVATEIALPKRIVVRIIDEIGDVVEEGEMDENGELLNFRTVKGTEVGVKAARWHDVKGRKLNGKPMAKGAYIKNGNAVLVK